MNNFYELKKKITKVITYDCVLGSIIVLKIKNLNQAYI